MGGNSFLRHQLSCLYSVVYSMLSPSTMSLSNNTIYEPITTCCRLIVTNIINKPHKYDDGATIYTYISPNNDEILFERKIPHRTRFRKAMTKMLLRWL